MTQPTPQRPGLQDEVAELRRRLDRLESSDGLAPAARTMVLGPFPWNGGDGVGGWPGTALTEWTTLMHWRQVAQWRRLDALLLGASTGDRGWQLRIVCDDVVLWVSPVSGGAQAFTFTSDLTKLLATEGKLGADLKWKIDAVIVSGTSGAVYLCPERIEFSSPRYV